VLWCFAAGLTDALSTLARDVCYTEWPVIFFSFSFTPLFSRSFLIFSHLSLFLCLFPFLLESFNFYSAFYLLLSFVSLALSISLSSRLSILMFVWVLFFLSIIFCSRSFFISVLCLFFTSVFTSPSVTLFITRGDAVDQAIVGVTWHDIWNKYQLSMKR